MGVSKDHPAAGGAAGRSRCDSGRTQAPPENLDPGRGPRVLVVDDDPVNLLLTSELLSRWGFGPLLAVDGAEAVALALELRPHLVLMDLQMPVLDGFEAVRRIRRFERELARERVPVVAYSASADVDPLRLRDCGIDAVLQKPCDAQALHECVRQWCSRSARRRPAETLTEGYARAQPAATARNASDSHEAD